MAKLSKQDKMKFLIFGKTIRLEPLMPIRICPIFLVVITTTLEEGQRAG